MNILDLNKIIKLEFEAEDCELEDLIFPESLVRIILSTDLKVSVPMHKHFFPFDKSIDYSYKFMNSIKSDYAYILEDALANKKVEFKSLNYEDPISKLLYYNGEKIISFVVTNTIEDTFTLTHEGFHYINTDLSNLSSNWNLMTEVISISAEYLQKLYLERNNLTVSEYEYNEISNLLEIRNKACKLDFEINLIKEYIKNKHIDDSSIHNLLKNKSDEYINQVCLDIEEMLSSGYMNFTYLQRYIIAACLSTHLVNRIINNPKKIGDFITLNDNCNNMSFVDSLKLLDLKLDDENYVILSDSSIKVLRKEYKERINNLIKK